MQINYKEVLKYILIGLALIVVSSFFYPVHAQESYVTIENETWTIAEDIPVALDNVMEDIPRIAQGGKVYVNDTVDISGVTGWPDNEGDFRIAYYDFWMDSRSPGDIEPKYILKLPGKNKMPTSDSQYHYYIDPAIFSTRPGYWYQYLSNRSGISDVERAGNLQAFYVIADYRTVYNKTNYTTVYRSGGYNETVIVPEPLLPERHIADYVVAKGDSINISAGDCRIWVFGRVDSIYDQRSSLILAEQIEGLESGNYEAVTQFAGSNTIYEASYSDDMITPGLYGKKPIDVTGFSPYVVYEKFQDILKGTDDRYYAYDLKVEEPMITIERATELYSNGNSYLDVRGYTNVANDTPVFVTLDEGKTYSKLIRFRNASTTAVRTSPGNLSYYSAYVPIDYDQLYANEDMHTLTARTSHGGVAYKDFKVSVLPPDSFKPNATLKYIEDRNPFVPTPTPIVNTVTVVQTVVQREVVTVVQTPDPSDYAKMAKGLAAEWVANLALAVSAAIGFVVAMWGIWIWLRVRRNAG